MPKLPRLTTVEAERALLTAGFELKGQPPHLWKRPNQSDGALPQRQGWHPKIITQVLETIKDAGQGASREA